MHTQLDARTWAVDLKEHTTVFRGGVVVFCAVSSSPYSYNYVEQVCRSVEEACSKK